MLLRKLGRYRMESIRWSLFWLVLVLVGYPPGAWYIRIIDLASRSRQSLQRKIVRGKVLIRHGLVAVISLICRIGHGWRGVISGSAARLSIVLSFTLYYKTGCQVL